MNTKQALRFLQSVVLTVSTRGHRGNTGFMEAVRLANQHVNRCVQWEHSDSSDTATIDDIDAETHRIAVAAAIALKSGLAQYKPAPYNAPYFDAETASAYGAMLSTFNTYVAEGRDFSNGLNIREELRNTENP